MIEYFEYDFHLENEGVVSIQLFDIQGRLIKILYEDYIKKGDNRVSFNVSHLNAGTYILTVDNTQEKLFTKKIIKY